MKQANAPRVDLRLHILACHTANRGHVAHLYMGDCVAQPGRRIRGGRHLANEAQQPPPHTIAIPGPFHSLEDSHPTPAPPLQKGPMPALTLRHSHRGHTRRKHPHRKHSHREYSHHHHCDNHHCHRPCSDILPQPRHSGLNLPLHSCSMLPRQPPLTSAPLLPASFPPEVPLKPTSVASAQSAS